MYDKSEITTRPVCPYCHHMNSVEYFIINYRKGGKKQLKCSSCLSSYYICFIPNEKFLTHKMIKSYDVNRSLYRALPNL